EWTLLTTYTQAIPNWQRDTLLLPQPSGTYQVAFEGRLHWGHGICVDDVSFFAERESDPVSAATVPYSCSFADATENDSWVLLNGSDTNRWVIGYAVNSGNDNMGSLYVSSDEGLSNFYLTGYTSTTFAYRDITLAAGQYAYSYDWYAMGETGRDYMRVALVPSTVTLTGGSLGAWSENTLPAGAMAMDGGHWLSGYDLWQTANDVVDVPTAGTYRLVVLWHNDDRYGDQPPAAIDNITLVENPCVLPTQLAFSSITSTGAVLTWQPGGSENRWEVTVNGSTYTVSTTPSYTLTGLQPNTDYQVELRSVCGNTRSLAARHITLHTTCAAQSLPYNYGFEDAVAGAGSAMPDCWARVSNTNFPYVVIQQSNAHSGSRALYFSHQTQYAILPAINIPDIYTLKLGFWARKVANSTYTVVVGMMSNPNDVSTFVPVDTVSDIAVAYTHYEVSLASYSGTGTYPALKVSATSNNFMYIDDIHVSACTYVVTESNPFTETFEESSITRACWKQEQVNGTLSWTFRQGGYNNIPSTSHGGTRNAYLYGTTNQRNYRTRLVSPILNTSAMNTVRMSFWHAQSRWGSDQDTLKVYSRPAPTQPWQLLATYSDNLSSWTYHELYMLGSDSLQVAFLGTARNGYGIVLDDVTFDEAPYCGEVLSLTAQVTDTITSTVRLSWNGSLGTNAYFRLEYGPTGFTTGTGTVVNNITTTTYDLSYLTVGTTYDFYVTTICNAVQQSAIVMTTLYIPPVADTAMPYRTSFDSVSDVSRWVLVNGTQTNQWAIGTATGNETQNPHALYISNSNGSNYNYNNTTSSVVFAYRTFRLAAGNYAYSYDWRCYGESSYDYLRVALLPDTVQLTAGNNTGWSTTALPSSAISLDGNGKLNLQNNWQNREGRFLIENEGVYRLVFFWRNDGDQGSQPPAAIDNITIDRMPLSDVVTALPYQCDFSDIIENARWSMVNGTQTNQWTTGTAGGTYPTGSAAMYISNDGGNTNAYTNSVATNSYAYRTFQLSAGSYDYSYSWRAYGERTQQGTDYDYLRVALIPASVPLVAGSAGNWTATSIPTDYIALDGERSLDAQSEWQQVLGRFEVTEAGLYNVVFFWHTDNNAGTQPPAAVDNIVLQPAMESCGTMSTLIATEVRDTSISLSWNSSASLFRIEYGPANFVPGTGTLVTNVPTRAYTVTGLSPVTTYDFYVSIDCGQLPMGASPMRLTMSTRSHIEDLPYFCDFSDAEENGNWALNNGTQTNQWFIGTATGNGDSHALYISNDNGVSNTYTLTTTSTVFAYRPFHLDSGRYVYSYDWHAGGEINYDFIRAVLAPSTTSISAGNTSNFSYNSLPADVIALDGGAQLNGRADWRTLSGTVDVPTSGDYYLLFYWRNDNSTGTQPPAAIDNVLLQLDDCEMPTEMVVSALSDTSATISWYTSMGSAWQVRCGNYVDTVYTRTATIPGLQASTDYTVSVRTLCGNNYAGAPSVIDLHTPCALLPLPYRYDFEDATASGRNGVINACWYKGTNIATTQGYPYPSNTYSCGNGIYSLYMVSSATYYSYVVLPQFDQPISRTVLSFWARRYSATQNNTLDIGVVTNPADITTFDLVESYTIPVTDPLDWQKCTVYFDTYRNNGRFLAIRLRGGATSYCYLDSILVDTLAECSGVVNIAVAATTDTSIRLTWHETGAASAWVVEYGLAGFTQGSGAVLTVTDTVATVTGLMHNTAYDFYIHSDCGHSISSAQMFTTQTDCGRMMLPFVEDFDNYRTSATQPIDRCWYKVYRQGNTVNQQSYPQFTFEASNTYLTFYSTRNNYSYLVLPPMEGDIHDQMVRFKMKSSGTDQAVIRVGVMTDPTNYNTFQQVLQVTNTSGNWET
ncbi:MAG: fibronectin type III domain-containing protein, partial [Bacteroidales bacterium]|nr:fibronectin type III domain-containing protein [Bacteroidales bacterium]